MTTHFLHRSVCHSLFVACCIGAVFSLNVYAATGCQNPTQAKESNSWSTMQVPQRPLEIAFTNEFGWVGLNHVTAEREIIGKRIFGIIPFFVPSVVDVFPFQHAIARISNQRPVLYIHADLVEALSPEFNPDNIHVVMLSVTRDSREIDITSGRTIFTYSPSFPSSREVPVKVQRLSSNVMSARIMKPLADGEYLVTVGTHFVDGYEFGIDCK